MIIFLVVLTVEVFEKLGLDEHKRASLLASQDRLSIVHVDMDAFYAAIEQRDNPRLQGKPVVVGGDPKQRGVVSTASYEARSFGIHSAMPSSRAFQLCPQAVFLKPRMKHYKEVSQEIFDIFYQYSNMVEAVSLDEAFLYIEGDALVVGKMIKEEIRERTGLTASVGVSFNKFLAKLGSDWEKPNGLTIFDKDRAQEILPGLKIRKIWGIGPSSEKVLQEMGIYTIQDLRNYDFGYFKDRFGKRAIELVLMAWGFDLREVNSGTGAKSLGEEITFERDVSDRKILEQTLEEFTLALWKRMQQRGYLARTVTVKVRYEDFSTITRSKSLEIASDDLEEIRMLTRKLLSRIDLRKNVRLVGLQVSNLANVEEPIQLRLPLFGENRDD